MCEIKRKKEERKRRASRRNGRMENQAKSDRIL